MSWKKSTPVTFIEIEIAAHKQCCLFDTGCAYSIIPRQLVPTMILSPVHMDILAANGAPICILGCMIVKFHIEGMPIIANLKVSEDIH